MRGVCTASSDAGRGAVAGWERWRCGAVFPPRRSKPLRPGVHAARHWDPPTSWPPALSERLRHDWVPQRWTGALAQEGARKVNPPGAERSKPPTSRAGRRRLADLRQYLLRQASMSRGVEARGSLGTSGVPRALFFRGALLQETACPGPTRIRAAERWLAFTHAQPTGNALDWRRPGVHSPRPAGKYAS